MAPMGDPPPMVFPVSHMPEFTALNHEYPALPVMTYIQHDSETRNKCWEQLLALGHELQLIVDFPSELHPGLVLRGCVSEVYRRAWERIGYSHPSGEEFSQRHSRVSLYNIYFFGYRRSDVVDRLGSFTKTRANSCTRTQ